MPHVCDICFTNPGGNLKTCSRCHSAYYCGVKHQKQDWPLHKKACRQAAAAKAANESSSEMVPVIDAMNRLTQTALWDGMSKKKVYKRLIDIYRFRVEDEYSFTGEARGLYAMEDPLPDFAEFLQLAKETSTLPSWWNQKVDGRALFDLATTPGDYSSLEYPIEKDDILKEYGDIMAPMNLRSTAERVYGNSCMPGGELILDAMRRTGDFPHCY